MKVEIELTDSLKEAIRNGIIDKLTKENEALRKLDADLSVIWRHYLGNVYPDSSSLIDAVRDAQKRAELSLEY